MSSGHEWALLSGGFALEIVCNNLQTLNVDGPAAVLVSHCHLIATCKSPL
jgi:hypothetical protein